MAKLTAPPHRRGGRRVVSSRHFRTAFLMLLFVCLVLYGLVAALLLHQTASSLQEEAQSKANNMSAAVQELFSATQSNAVFVGSMTSVERLVQEENPSLDDYIELSSDMSAFSNVDMYVSIDIFLEKPRMVYVSKTGLYPFGEYPSQDLIELIDSDGAAAEQWIVRRDYLRYYDPARPVATFLRRIPLYSVNGSGYVAMHISYRELESLVRDRIPDNYGVLVAYQNTLIYTIDEFSIQTQFLDDAMDFAESHGVICAPSAGGTAVQCVFLIPPQVVWARVAPSIPAAIAAFFLMILAVAFCSYLYSRAMLRPVDALMRKAGYLTGPGDEYDRLNSAFDRLSDELDSINQQMRRELPLIQEQIVLELVSSYVEIPDDYEEQGISFPYDSFAVVAAALPERFGSQENALREPLKLIVRSRTMERLSSLGVVYSAYGESQSLLFLLNVKYSGDVKQKILRLCEPLAKELTEAISMPVVFAAGICPKGVRTPYLAYMQARRILTYVGDAEEPGAYLSGPSERAPVIDLPTVSRIARCVLDRDQPRLRELLDRYFKTYLPADSSTEEARRFSNLILCHVHARLLEMDVQTDSSQLGSSLKKLAAAKSYDECLSILLAWFSSQMNTHNHLPEESYAYVRRAVSFIKEHYQENLSVPDIAQAVSLNPVYLNKLFKLSTGKTISEYLNSYRIDASKPMLLEEGATVAAVSSQLGYNDVRSFIRFFKKFTGITPGDYRQQNHA